MPSAGAGTLREAMQRRAALGQRLGLEAAVAQVVPLCLEIAEVHAQGYGFFLHPSSVAERPDGSLLLARERATLYPADPHDCACLPPETQPGQLNDARGNVYAIGAIFYELLTGASVGPGMRRPADFVPNLPAALDGVLSVALITDPERRPNDLRALARHIQQLLGSPRPSAPPLPALEMTLHGIPSSIPALNLRPPHPSLPVDVSLSHRPNHSLPVDVSVSSIPPNLAMPRAPVPLIINGANGTPIGVPPSAMGMPPSSAAFPPSSAGVPPSSAAVPPSSSLNGYGVAVQAPQAAPDLKGPAQAARIAELKAQLEADPRPRYFVIKSGMDHGPFTAVELVRQIDSHSFTDEDHVVDSIEGRRAPLLEWSQFALFAEYAKRERQLMQRQKDIVKVAAAEKKSTRGKTLAGLLLLLGVIGVGGIWYSTTAAERRDGVVIQEDESTNVETDGALSVKGKKKARKRSSSGTPGSIPVVAGGQSCEAALDAYNEDKSMGEEGQADITAGQYGRVLNSGAYFSHCGVPFSMSVSICAAVQNGRAVGVTVTTQPNDAKRAACVAGAVRGLNFPSHPKLDVTRTRFDAQ
jgi:eukaryotic-like serine/threonine-protein kinase